MATEYLVDAANDMFRIISQDGENTPAQVARAAARGCDVLRRVQEDQTFRQSIRESMHQLSQTRQEHPEEFQAVLGQRGNSWEQFDSFLVQERAVLQIAGVESGLVEELITQGREYIGQARDWQGDENQVFGLIAQLRDQTCGLVGRLKAAQDAAQYLAQAAERYQHLEGMLDQALFERQVAVAELAGAKEQNRVLAEQCESEQQTNQALRNQLAETGPRADLRGKSRIIWRITRGIGGIVLVVANVAAAPLIGPNFSSASATIGATLISTAVTN